MNSISFQPMPIPSQNRHQDGLPLCQDQDTHGKADLLRGARRSVDPRTWSGATR
jgi:hypothetical protein